MQTIFAKELETKIHKEIIQLQQKNKKTKFKNEQKNRIDIFQRGHINGQLAYEKVLSIINQGDKNQNYNEISLLICFNGYYQKDKRQQVLADVRDKDILVHCWWECKLVSH